MSRRESGLGDVDTPAIIVKLTNTVAALHMSLS